MSRLVQHDDAAFTQIEATRSARPDDAFVKAPLRQRLLQPQDQRLRTLLGARPFRVPIDATIGANEEILVAERHPENVTRSAA